MSCLERTYCFSERFVNKFGFRSMSNSKSSLFNSKPNFLKKIWKDITGAELKKELGAPLKGLLLTIRRNMRKYMWCDFRDCFEKLREREVKELAAVEKCKIVEFLMIVLRDVLGGSDFFGCCENEQRFKTVVSRVIFSMAGEHVFGNELVKKWNISKLLWIPSDADASKTEFLCRMLVWILRDVVAAIIALIFYVTTTSTTYELKKLYFYFKDEWKRFHDKHILKMVESKTIVRRSMRKCEARALPAMRFILKPNKSVRVIIQYPKNKARTSDETTRKQFLKLLTPQLPLVSEEYLKIYRIWSQRGRPKLYFIKADLKNAFGSVDKSLLIKILAQRHAEFQKTTAHDSGLKKMAAAQYCSLVRDLKRPILVRNGSSVFEWRHGLVQGLRYSPALCEIYYRYLDNQYLNTLKNSDCIRMVSRTVDDYLYVSENLEDALNFLDYLYRSGIVNEGKTITNFTSRAAQCSNTLSYLGLLYDTVTLQVNRDETIYCGQICYRISFGYAIQNRLKFLSTRIGQTCIPIPPQIFNLYYNKEESVWKSIFSTLCISANRFCTILTVLFPEINDPQCVFLAYKKKVSVSLVNKIIETIQRNKPSGEDFIHCINHVRYLAYKALYLYAVKIPHCSKIISLIKTYLKKTNCMDGAWRSHARVIDRDGFVTHHAVRDICRRLLIKNVVKQCLELPSGYEAYRKVRN